MSAALTAENGGGVSASEVEVIARGYLRTQLDLQFDMSSPEYLDSETRLSDNYGLEDVAEAYRRELTSEITGFVDDLVGPASLEEYLSLSMFRGDRENGLEQFGADLYLTRERHGAGYWDRAAGDLGDHLTKWAHSLGSADTLHLDLGTRTITSGDLA